jgi:hypothetical protein
MSRGESERCRSGHIFQDLIEQFFALEQPEVLAKLHKVDPVAIRTQEGVGS